MMAAALSAHTAGIQQIVIVEAGTDSLTLRDPQDRPEEGRAATGSEPLEDDALDRAIALQYLPFSIQLRLAPDEQRALAGSLPFLSGMRPVGGVTAAYVCRDFTCRQPVTTIEALQQELGTTV